MGKEHRHLEKGFYELDNSTKVSLLSDLTKRWERRHAFIWSVFFKMLTFYFVAITTPAFLYFQLKPKSETSINNNLEIIIFIFSLVVLIFTLITIKKIVYWIGNEEKRQKSVLEAARNIYDSFCIKMTPDALKQEKKQDCNASELTECKNYYGLLEENETLFNCVKYEGNAGIMTIVIGIFARSIIIYAIATPFILLSLFLFN
jgi:flagellar basal body-associated protein FliL